MANAEAAGQYTEVVAQQQTAAGQNKVQDTLMPKLPIGWQVWVRVKNVTNNSHIDFLVGVHEYPAIEF